MSRLTDKYQSYIHYKGISFDEQTFTANPTKTGSKSFQGDPVATMGTITSDGANNANVKIGILPNQNYYEFEFDSTVTPNKNARLIYGSTSTGVAGGLGDIRRTMWDSPPIDRVVGFWMKMPSQIGIDNSVQTVHRWLYGTQALINIGPAKTNNTPAIGIIHSTAEFTHPTLTPSVSYYTGYTDENNNLVNIEWDKWYFVAVRKIQIEDNFGNSVNSVVTGTLEYQHLINGQLVNTITKTTWTKRSVNGIVFGNNSVAAGMGNVKVGVSSWFVSDWSDITQAGLKEIYKYGAPIQTPIKYYDGTTFQDDISPPKVYFNNAWQDVYASRYNGTQWVPI